MTTATELTDIKVLAEGLLFPEGPVALPNGDVIVTELIGKRLTRVAADGTVSVIADLGGSPNGCAIGPDGAAYVCNSGGFASQEMMGFLVPQGLHGETEPEDYIGGRIQRVDLATGEWTDLYTACDGNQLRGPNDIVFDAAGGFWFTDHGKMQRRTADRGGLYYALPDGSSIREVVYPLDAPNGVGLSPDDNTVYAAETHTGRLYSWQLSGPGQVIDGGGMGNGSTLVCGLPGNALFDSLGVEADGNICVATIMSAGISVISPTGAEVSLAALPPELFDLLPTNICWGGPDLTTAYITLSSTKKLISCTWPRPGLPLHFLNR